MEIQICKKCKKSKKINEFSKHSVTKSGYRSICKICQSIYRKKYHKKNNKEQLQKNKEYKSKNPEKYKELTKLKFTPSYILTCKKHTENYKFSYKLICLHKELYKKWLEFQFEEDMDWNNYGKIWNIDHVIPFSKLDLYGKEKICLWSNTRPYYINDNNFKKDKIDKDDYENHLQIILLFKELILI